MSVVSFFRSFFTGLSAFLSGCCIAYLLSISIAVFIDMVTGYISWENLIFPGLVAIFMPIASFIFSYYISSRIWARKGAIACAIFYAIPLIAWLDYTNPAINSLSREAYWFFTFTTIIPSFTAFYGGDRGDRKRIH